MVLSFAGEVSSSARVDVVLSTPAAERSRLSAPADSSEETSSGADEITATRVNPYTYKFNAPPGQLHPLSLYGAKKIGLKTNSGVSMVFKTLEIT